MFVMCVLVIPVCCAKTAEPIDMPFLGKTRVGQGTVYQMGVHISTTWRVRLNDPCYAAMQAITTITVTGELSH